MIFTVRDGYGARVAPNRLEAKFLQRVARQFVGREIAIDFRGRVQPAFAAFETEHRDQLRVVDPEHKVPVGNFGPIRPRSSFRRDYPFTCFVVVPRRWYTVYRFG